mgnify:CR=1 FL=1
MKRREREGKGQVVAYEKKFFSNWGEGDGGSIYALVGH